MPKRAPVLELNPNSSLEIARRIRAARARAGLTRKQLATASAVSERYLAHLEAGSGNPSVDMLLVLAEALDLPLAELLPFGGERSELAAEAAALLRRLQPDQMVEAMALLKFSARVRGGKARRIVLIGLRGAGKSTLGAALAEKLGFPFIEISKEVERAYGGSIELLLDIGGQAALRRYEAEVVKNISSEQPDAVISAPGAIVSDAPLFEFLLASAWSIWLEANPKDHMARVMAQGDFRPMSGNRAPMQDLKNILAARSADYGRADARLNTSAQNFSQTLEKLQRIAQKLIK
jgi:XRE family aerobic/anaerobic benzoate catabolism transcriptional regulator